MADDLPGPRPGPSQRVPKRIKLLALLALSVGLGAGLGGFVMSDALYLHTTGVHSLTGRSRLIRPYGEAVADANANYEARARLEMLLGGLVGGLAGAGGGLQLARLFGASLRSEE
jgi:hypothetical protein